MPSVFSAMTGGSGAKKGEKDADDGVWQDRDIRFDTTLPQLAIRPGEVQIDSINSVEDTKGNNGEKGSLAITNLRLVWICNRNSRINLSIGYSAVQSINIKQANSRLRGNTQALYVMTKYNNARFEFVFTNLVRQSPRLFTTVQAVYRACEQSLPCSLGAARGASSLLVFLLLSRCAMCDDSLSSPPSSPPRQTTPPASSAISSCAAPS